MSQPILSTSMAYFVRYGLQHTNNKVLRQVVAFQISTFFMQR